MSELSIMLHTWIDAPVKLCEMLRVMLHVMLRVTMPAMLCMMLPLACDALQPVLPNLSCRFLSLSRSGCSVAAQEGWRFYNFRAGDTEV